jgi:dolichol-phosphate mannosyltransferase
VLESITLSVVVPLYNEENNVEPLVRRLTEVLEGIKESYEILLIDDGSRDATWEVIKTLSNSNSRLKALGLSRNFGHQHALLAGLSHAQGQAVISMDGDLQHPPEVIPELVGAWKKGFKVVVTDRRGQEALPLFKRLTSKYFYKIFSFMSEVSLSEGSSDFRLIDRSALESLLSFRDANIFLRGAVQWLGFPSITVCYNVAERFSGQTKFSLKKMLRFAIGAVVSFSTKPLRLGIWIGILTSVLAFLEILYVLIQYIRGMTVTGWASVVGILSLMFGFLFILLGVIGSYLGSIHQALQNRPKFIVDRHIKIAKSSTQRIKNFVDR